MKSYLNLISHILENGEVREDRTNVGTISSFGHQLKFDLRDGFPAVTTKKLAWKGVVSELIWFLEGSDDERRLAEIRYNKNRDELTDIDKYPTIWTDNADKQGKDLGYENSYLIKKLGPVYGVQWRSWKDSGGQEIDQISNLMDSLRKNPDSRRHIVSAWNVGDIDKMKLPPCHVLFQFYVVENQLSCQLYQRSADVFLGVPFNIASYALLTVLIANTLDLELGDFIHTLGDAHLYSNHIEQAKLQLERQPRVLPKIKIINKYDDIFSYQYKDIQLMNYEPYDHIKAPVSV